MKEPYVSHLRYSRMICFTKLLRYAKRRLAVLPKKAQEVVISNKICLRRFSITPALSS
jgi:hypothetical protein